MYKFFTQPNGRDSEFEFTCEADEHSFALYRQTFREYLTTLNQTAYVLEDYVLTTVPNLRPFYKRVVSYLSNYESILNIEFSFAKRGRQIDSLNFAELQLEFMHIITQIETKYNIYLTYPGDVKDIHCEFERLINLIQPYLDSANINNNMERKLNA